VVDDSEQREVARLAAVLHREMKHPDFLYASGVEGKFGPNLDEGWVQNAEVPEHNTYSDWSRGVVQYWRRPLRADEGSAPRVVAGCLVPPIGAVSETERLSVVLHHLELHPDFEYLQDRRGHYLAEPPDESWVVNEPATERHRTSWKMALQNHRSGSRPGNRWMRPIGSALPTRERGSYPARTVQGRLMVAADGPAVGRFEPEGPLGYRAKTAPDALVRNTREEAVDDERVWRTRGIQDREGFSW
jgi:hypothetical protein